MKFKKYRTGFVMSLVAVSLILLLVLLSTSLHDSYLSLERALTEPQALMYASTLFDDVGYDINELIGPEITITERDNSTIILISDSLPKGNFSSKLSTYENFLENGFEPEIHAEVNANFSNLTNGLLSIYINEEYLYQNNYSGDNEIIFKNNSKDVVPLSYEIDITILEVRKSVTDFEWDDGEPGVMNVTLEYTDLNGTEILNGQLNPNELNYLKIEYEGNNKQVEIRIGEFDNSEGSFKMKEQNITVSFSLQVEVLKNTSRRIGYEYDATLNYTQGDIYKSGYIRR